jgi:mono/diheme cytochrome c family protein
MDMRTSRFLPARGLLGALPALAALGLLFHLFGAAAASEPMPPDPEQLERGHALYRVYCETCHGKTGAGDGPTSRVLRVAPPDLTRLNRRNEGEFPRERVYRAIDGRDALAGHGSRQMPIWGLDLQEFGTDVHQEPEIRLRIEQLIDYLESIQRRP